MSSENQHLKRDKEALEKELLSKQEHLNMLEAKQKELARKPNPFMQWELMMRGVVQAFMKPIFFRRHGYISPGDVTRLNEIENEVLNVMIKRHNRIDDQLRQLELSADKAIVMLEKLDKGRKWYQFKLKKRIEMEFIEARAAKNSFAIARHTMYGVTPAVPPVKDKPSLIITP